MFAAVAHPAQARGEPALDDISRYLVAGGSLSIDKVTQTTLEMWHEGDYATLMGPITILVAQVGVESGGGGSATVKIEAGKTYTVYLHEYTDTHPGDWNATITLVSVDISAEVDLEVLLGPSGKEASAYIESNATDPSKQQALEQATKLRTALTDAVKATGVDPDQPKTSDLVESLADLAKAAAYKDSAGQLLFPTFGNKKVQQVLIRMAFAAYGNQKNDDAFHSLCKILIGMDIANYKPPATSPTQPPA
jgi:hypothetical protein